MKLLLLLCLLSPWLFGHTSTQEIRPGVVTVSEGAHALLPCALGSRQSIEKFDWRKDNGEKKEVFFYDRGSHYDNGLQGQDEQFKDRVVFFQDELKSGNASIIIINTRLEDNGTYTCLLFGPQRQEFNIRLNVVGDLKIRNISGAAPLPYINQDLFKNAIVLLECKAQGVPKPEVAWTDSAGVFFSAGDTHVTASQDASGRFHMELRTNVTKSDTYTCVVTQGAIYHQINRTVKVHFPESSTGWIVTVVALSMVVIVMSIIIIKQRFSKGPNEPKQGQIPLNRTNSSGQNEDNGMF